MLKKSFIARYEYSSNEPGRSKLYLDDLKRVLGYYFSKVSSNLFSFNLNEIDKLEIHNELEDYYISTIYLKLELSFNSEVDGGEINYILFNEFSFMPSLNNLMPVFFAFEKENATKLLYKGRLFVSYDDNSYYNHMRNSENRITSLGRERIVNVDFGLNRTAAFKTKLEVSEGDIVYVEGEYEGLAGIVEDAIDYSNEPMMLEVLEAYTE